MSGIKPGQKAFTLVEIAIALGIVAFALVAILGMIPVALDASRESRALTRATMIAQTLTDTFRSGGQGQGIVESAPATWSPKAFPASGSAETYTSAYNEEGFLLGNAGDYASGTGMPADAIFLARLIVTTRVDGIVQLEARVETPAAAQRANRKTYSFVTLIHPGFTLPTP